MLTRSRLTDDVKEFNGDEFLSVEAKILTASLKALSRLSSATSRRTVLIESKEEENDENDEEPSAPSHRELSYPTFSSHYQSLVQSAHALFSRLMPVLTKRIEDGGASRGAEGLAPAVEVSLCQCILEFLSALAAHNPSNGGVTPSTRCTSPHALLSFFRHLHGELGAVPLRLSTDG